MLRAFVSSDCWTENDLTDCLRKCSYNVERAAECLMTGQYKKRTSSSGSKQKNHLNFSLSSSNQQEQQPQHSMAAGGSTSTTIMTNNHQKTATPKPALRLRHPNNTNNLSKNAGKMPLSISSSSTGHGSSSSNNNNNNNKKAAPPAMTSTSSKSLSNSTTTSSSSTTTTGWILCQRWISDAICTTRNGKIAYKEPLQLSASIGNSSTTTNKNNTSKSGGGTVRFRAKHMEGHLPVALAAMLAPLACYTKNSGEDDDKDNNNNNNNTLGIISIQAFALMASSCTPMGGHVPLAVIVSIVQPKVFFQLFAAAAAAPTEQNNKNTSLFLENKKRKSSNKMKRWVGCSTGDSGATAAARQAAFDLLQWAEYGDVPDFATTTTTTPAKAINDNTKNAGDTNSSNESEAGNNNNNNNNNRKFNTASSGNDDNDDESKEEDDIEWKEDDFEEESVATAEGQEMDQSLTMTLADANASLPETECPNDMKVKGIELRPYQKQALFWMIERENKASRQQLEDQLAFLAELAEKTSAGAASQHSSSSSSSSSPTNGTAHDKAAIVCECGPVLVSEAERIKSNTLDGQVNPIDHPLWKRRFLASPDMTNTVSFYVNELLGLAADCPPEPPKPCSGGILAGKWFSLAVQDLFGIKTFRG